MRKLENLLGYLIHGKKPPQSESHATPRKKRPAPPRRGPQRSEPYKAWIRTLPSLVSGKTPCEACHTGQDGGMAMKANDFSCVPLTREEHREYHQIGRRPFERKYGVNFVRACKRLRGAWRAEGRAA